MKMPTLVLMLMLLALAPLSPGSQLGSHAAPLLWLGSGSAALWDDPRNWNASHVPTSSDDVYFSLSTSSATTVRFNQSSYQIAALHITASSDTTASQLAMAIDNATATTPVTLAVGTLVQQHAVALQLSRSAIQSTHAAAQSCNVQARAVQGRGNARQLSLSSLLSPTQASHHVLQALLSRSPRMLHSLPIGCLMANAVTAHSV